MKKKFFVYTQLLLYYYIITIQTLSTSNSIEDRRDTSTTVRCEKWMTNSFDHRRIAPPPTSATAAARISRLPAPGPPAAAAVLQ